ncbi:MAG TPA: ATP-dependent 6-phosphofructokinase, partial [Tepidanaerobacteraceae bacterium]|nr:ATP-dependent 6-phosphofructokinase [Tepidanaerobacteraceae bacterium]
RILASRFGGKAIDLLKENVRDKMIGLINGEMVLTDIDKVLSTTKPLDMEVHELADILSY